MRFVSGLRDPPDNLDLDALRDAITIDEVEMAVLFGSFAAGTQGPLSDLDIAIKFHESVSRSRRFKLLDELTIEVVSVTSIEAVDVLDLDSVGPAIGYEALRSGTLLYGQQSEAIDLETAFLLRKLDFQPVKRAWDRALQARLRDGSYGRT